MSKPNLVQRIHASRTKHIEHRKGNVIHPLNELDQELGYPIRGMPSGTPCGWGQSAGIGFATYLWPFKRVEGSYRIWPLNKLLKGRYQYENPFKRQGGKYWILLWKTMAVSSSAAVPLVITYIATSPHFVFGTLPVKTFQSYQSVSANLQAILSAPWAQSVAGSVSQLVEIIKKF